MQKSFSDIFVKTAECPDGKKRFDYTDNSLILRVSNSGTRTFLYQYRFQGKRRLLTLGRYPDISLKQARDSIALAKADLINGIDPQSARDESKQTQLDSGTITLGQGLDLFMERRAKPHIKSWKQYASDFDALPDRMKNTPIVNLKRVVIRDYLLDIGAKLNPSNANRKLKYMKSALTWLCDNEYIDNNPIANLKKPYPDEDAVVRERVLDDNELKSVLQVCHQLGYPWGHFFMVLAYTGQRRNEVSNMTWGELDLENAIWTISSSRTKNGKEHKVPLCKTVLDIIRDAPESDGGDYVFSTTLGDRPIQCFTKPKKQIDTQSQVTDWVIHTLRHTTLTNLIRQKVSDVVVSKVANHSTKKLQGVTSRYNKHDYLEERTDALNNYGAWLDRLVADEVADNVVELVQ